MTASQHFAFESVNLETGIAHNGHTPIRFYRARVKEDGFAGNFLDYVTIPPGADIGLHTHAVDNEEVYVIISGRGRMRLDDQEFDVEAGHVIINRPGGTHSLRNTHDADLRLIVIEIPQLGS